MKRLRRATIAPLLVVLLAVPAVGIAGDEEYATEDPHAAEAAEHEEHGGGHHLRDFKNEVALFLGSTDEHGHDSEFTWGLDYKRRVAERWAIGGYFDYAGGELRNTVLGVLVGFWPGLGNLQLMAGPGVEFHEGRDQVDHYTGRRHES